MARFNPTNNERAAISALTILSASLQFPQEKRDLLDLVNQLLPRMRRQGYLVDLIAASEQMFAARTVVEWSYAQSRVSRALLPILRLDLVQADDMAGARR